MLGSYISSKIIKYNTESMNCTSCESAISLPLVTHTEDTVLPARSFDSCCSGFVWNQFPRVGIITRLNDVITVQAYTCTKCFKYTNLVLTVPNHIVSVQVSTPQQMKGLKKIT